MSHHAPDDRMAHQRQVPDGIQSLVTHELVLVPELVVQHTGLTEDDGIRDRLPEEACQEALARSGIGRVQPPVRHLDRGDGG